MKPAMLEGAAGALHSRTRQRRGDLAAPRAPDEAGR